MRVIRCSRMTRDDKELKSCPMIDNSRNDYCASLSAFEFVNLIHILIQVVFFVCISYRGQTSPL